MAKWVNPVTTTNDADIKLVHTDNTDVIANACKKISELEQENEKLKGELEEAKTNLQRERDLRRQDIQDGMKAVKELIQAREIIKEWLQWANDDTESPKFQEIVNQAEQFIGRTE